MLRTISCALILFASIHSSAFAALTLKTERNAVCGVELYEERFDGDVCGWVYFEKQSSACELDYYKLGADLSCPWVRCWWPQNNSPGERIWATEYQLGDFARRQHLAGR